MKETIEHFCSNGQNNGLLLIDSPTGSGKTYSVVQYIANELQNTPDPKNKIYFITTLKKNIKDPLADLRKTIKDDVFEKNVLFLDSTIDAIIEGYTKNLFIPEKIRRSDEFKDLEKGIELLKKDNVDAQFLSEYKNAFRLKEKAFRKLLRRILKDTFKSKQDILTAIHTNNDWKWIGSLYPAVFLEERKVVFMSIDKFLVQCDTLVDSPFFFKNNPKVLSGATVFIDEIDAAKETIIKAIIENGIKDKIDILDLFIQLHRSLHMHRFSDMLLRQSSYGKENYPNSSPDAEIKKLQDKSNEIFEKHHLLYSYRTSPDADEKTRSFLFNDYSFHTIITKKDNKYITTTFSEAEKLNIINTIEGQPENNNDNLQRLLLRIRKFIEQFVNATRKIASNYKQVKDTIKKPQDDLFPYESAVLTVLSEFSLNQIYKNYLYEQVLSSVNSSKTDDEKKKNNYIDNSFFNKGFYYFDIENDRSHDTQSILRLYSFETTPEKILLQISQKAKVVGISATATVNSILGNFHWEYLKKELKDAFVEVSEEDRNRMATNYVDSIKGYVEKNVEVVTEFIKGYPDSSYCKDDWGIVFEDQEDAEDIYNILDQKQLYSEKEDNLSNNSHYKEVRYLRIAQAYKFFLSKNEIKSFLCILTTHPKDSLLGIDKGILEDVIFWKIRESLGIKDSNVSVKYLRGEEYESNKTDITDLLSKGKKLFVISVYQTIGAGQNLQYMIPEGLDLVAVGNRSKNEKDFDAIYIDNPTNLIPNLRDENLSEEDFIKFLFSIDYLQESGEISSATAEQFIKTAFKVRFSNPYEQAPKENLRNTFSYKNYGARAIVQAIGRICRTHNKNKKIYVLADDSIRSCLECFTVKDDRLLNPEFRILHEQVDALEESGIISDREKRLKNIADLSSQRCQKYIGNLLNYEWTIEKMKNWELLRDFVLRNPTLANTSDEFCRLYVQQPENNNKLKYEKVGDYEEVSIIFDRYKESEEVSASAAKLDSMLRYDSLKDYFESKGYATYFASNPYIMCPPLFAEIYKGALGEIAGRYIFENKLGISLEEIKDPLKFEKFDFKVKDKPIFVDFKNWHVTTSQFMDYDKQMRKIISKARICGCKCVFIVNIIEVDSWKPIETEDCEGIHIIQIPSLLVETPQQVELNMHCCNKIRDIVTCYANED